MLCKWEELPKFMRTPEVWNYYHQLSCRKFSLLAKRTFDFVLSTVLLLFFMPVFLCLAVWVKLDSPGPVFYCQERVTQYGRIFKIYKFRTMVQDADKKGNLVTVYGDERITKAGKKLREYRLDEIPQLVNIWKGEMSFVGTRPEVVKYVKKYTKEMYATLLLPAGVTSEASIRFKNENVLLQITDNVEQIYIHQVMTEKMVYNLKSLKEFSLHSEIITIIKTGIYFVQRIVFAE